MTQIVTVDDDDDDRAENNNNHDDENYVVWWPLANDCIYEAEPDMIFVKSFTQAYFLKSRNLPEEQV